VSRKNFDEKKALEYFRKIEGTPYATESALYTAFDAVNATFPSYTDDNFWVFFLNQLSRIGMKSSVNDLMTTGLNKRLGMDTDNTNLSDTIAEIAKRKLDLSEVMAIPDKREWNIDEKTNTTKFICVGMVLEILIFGGMFEGININPSEFTPHDLFMINIYDEDDSKLPWQCKVNNPGWKYCQIGGNKEINGIDIYNTIKPYNGMNERCPGNDNLRINGC